MQIVPIPAIVKDRVVTVDELVHRLCAVAPDDFNPDRMGALLRGVRVDAASLQPYMHWQPRHYTRNLIHRTNLFELLAVCWEPGSVSAIHNHAGQECWLCVHAGKLCIDSFDLIDACLSGRVGQGVAVRRRERLHQVPSGVVDHRGPHDDIHRVINRRAFGQRAVSLHVYARPIDQCIVYDPRRALAQYKVMRYHSVAGRLL